MIRCLAAAALALSACAVLCPRASAQPAPILEQSALDSLEQINTLILTGSLNDAAVLIEPIKRRAIAARDTFVLVRVLAQECRIGVMQSRISDAEKIGEDAIELAVATSDTTGWAITLGWMTWVYNLSGRSPLAMETSQRRLALAQSTGNLNVAAWSHVSLAYMNLMSGDAETARIHYTKAIEGFTAAGDSVETLTPLVGLGRVYHNLGDVEAARAVYKRVWALARDLGNTENEAHAVNNLGTIEYERGNPELAAQLFQRAVDIHYAAGWYTLTITPLANVAGCYTYLGQYEEARRVLDRALDIIEQHEVSGRRWEVVEELATIHELHGENNAARQAYEEVLSSAPRSSGTYGGAARSLVRLHVEAGRPADAMSILDRILENEEELIVADQLSLRVDRARIMADMGQAAEAAVMVEAVLADAAVTNPGWSTLRAKLTLSHAYRALDDGVAAQRWLFAALDDLDTRREQMQDDQWKEGLGHHTSRSMVDAAGVLLEYPISASEATRCAAFFDFVEHSRARTLVERIGRRWQIEETSFTSMEQLQRDVLRQDEVLLEFVMGERSNYLVAVSRDACRVVTLLRDDVLEDRTSLYYRMMGVEPVPVNDALSRMHLKSGATLGRLLLSDVADLLENAKRIFVVSDGYFASVPFGTLSLPEQDTMLMESSEVVHVPSATVLALTRTHRAADPVSNAVLAVMPAGEHDLAGAVEEVAQLQRIVGNVEIWAHASPGEDAGGELARYQVLHVAAHVEVNNEQPWHSTIRLEGAGTADAHTRSAPSSPLLVASPEQEAAFDAAFRGNGIRALDVAEWPLRARLAVLSGCESASGRASIGEGVIGLTSAFLSAGVPTVVATLWPIDDTVTATLMREFYSQLTRGQSVADALRNAQLAVRATPATRHPFFWAGFVVVGDGAAQIDLTEKTTSSIGVYAIVALVGLVIGGALGVFHRRKKAQKGQHSV